MACVQNELLTRELEVAISVATSARRAGSLVTILSFPFNIGKILSVVIGNGFLIGAVIIPKAPHGKRWKNLHEY